MDNKLEILDIKMFLDTYLGIQVLIEKISNDNLFIKKLVTNNRDDFRAAVKETKLTMRKLYDLGMEKELDRNNLLTVFQISSEESNISKTMDQDIEGFNKLFKILKTYIDLFQKYGIVEYPISDDNLRFSHHLYEIIESDESQSIKQFEEKPCIVIFPGFMFKDFPVLIIKPRVFISLK
jgi:hypothetical protein